MQQFIDGMVLNDVFTVGLRNLKKNMSAINDLNVFPVPDGDTGTNMVHTFGGGLGAVAAEESVSEYMKKLSSAVLLSARGNSGVIFSQFIYGFARGVENKEQITFADLTNAFLCAKEDAYKAIIAPTEGTILTVIREAAEFLGKNADKFDNFKTGIAALIDCMKDTLARTPDMLAVLKEAGVVDSGAAGLVCFFEGMYAYFCGVEIEEIEDFEATAKPVINTSFGADSVMEYGYCTEFILQLMNAKTDIAAFSKEALVKELEKLGDSIVAVQNDSIVKIHIHTFTPEKVLELARSFGEFVTLKIENMSVQHSETVTQAPAKEKVKYAVVAVASGEGIIDYFYSIGATAVINGGQTNNPSVDDFLKAFDGFEAEHIIVLPNNSNIILTANQAAEIYKNSDVRVLPTKSVVEGYSALSMMNLWSDTVEELIADMTSGLESVVSAYVTTATRDAFMDGVEIAKGDFLGIRNKEILVSLNNRFEAATALIDKVMAEDEKAVVIVFYGQNTDEAEVEALKDYLEENYPLVDIGFIEGKQDIYDYIISME
ncbi:MAG: DAK2 domain-containing protein [Clostridia bacterium]|nr:DAK2 domain-containing protein [Clostridia bacterium]